MSELQFVGNKPATIAEWGALIAALRVACEERRRHSFRIRSRLPQDIMTTLDNFGTIQNLRDLLLCKVLTTDDISFMSQNIGGKAAQIFLGRLDAIMSNPDIQAEPSPLTVLRIILTDLKDAEEYPSVWSTIADAVRLGIVRQLHEDRELSTGVISWLIELRLIGGTPEQPEFQVPALTDEQLNAMIAATLELVAA